MLYAEEIEVIGVPESERSEALDLLRSLSVDRKPYLGNLLMGA